MVILKVCNPPKNVGGAKTWLRSFVLHHGFQEGKREPVKSGELWIDFSNEHAPNTQPEAGQSSV